MEYLDSKFPFFKAKLYENEDKIYDKEMPSIYDNKLPEIDLVFQAILTIET